jgi:hypothetical protein
MILSRTGFLFGVGFVSCTSMEKNNDTPEKKCMLCAILRYTAVFTAGVVFGIIWASTQAI